MTDLFEQQLRNAARSAPVPDAPPDLINRVLAERAAGERIILPTESATPRRSRTRLFAGLLAAASIAAVALLVVPTTDTRLPSTTADSISSTGFFGGTAYAEQLSSGPASPRLSELDGSRIEPRQYNFRMQSVDSAGRITPEGGGSIVVSAASYNSIPAWRIEFAAEHPENGQRRTLSETLLVTRRDLKPLTRVVHVRPFLRFSVINIEQRFTADSVLGTMTTDGGVRRPIARRLPAAYGPYLSDAIAPFALMGVPLSQSKTVGLSIIGWAVVSMDVFLPVTLRVVGDERIATATGTVDCWKVDVVAGSNHRIQWVRKSDGLGIRSYDTKATPNGHRQYELLNP